MDGLSAYQELMMLLSEIDHHVESFRTAACQVGKNERDYRVAIQAETLRLRSGGETATSTHDIVRGMEYIADLKCALICAEANRDAEREAINSKKLRARILQEQIAREYANTRGV